MSVIEYLLYADDMVHYIQGTDIEEIVRKLQEVLKRLDDWFVNQQLSINYSKTNCMVFHRANVMNVNNLPLVLNCYGNLVSRVYEFKYLGVYIDCSLSIKKRYEYVCTRVSSFIGVITRMKRFLTGTMVQLLIDSYIHSIIDYSLVIWAVRPAADYILLQRRIDHLFDTISGNLQEDVLTIEERIK